MDEAKKSVFQNNAQMNLPGMLPDVFDGMSLRRTKKALVKRSNSLRSLVTGGGNADHERPRRRASDSSAMWQHAIAASLEDGDDDDDDDDNDDQVEIPVMKRRNSFRVLVGETKRRMSVRKDQDMMLTSLSGGNFDAKNQETNKRGMLRTSSLRALFVGKRRASARSPQWHAGGAQDEMMRALLNDDSDDSYIRRCRSMQGRGNDQSLGSNSGGGGAMLNQEWANTAPYRLGDTSLLGKGSVAAVHDLDKKKKVKGNNSLRNLLGGGKRSQQRGIDNDEWSATSSGVQSWFAGSKSNPSKDEQLGKMKRNNSLRGLLVGKLRQPQQQQQMSNTATV